MAGDPFAREDLERGLARCADDAGIWDVLVRLRRIEDLCLRRLTDLQVEERSAADCLVDSQEMREWAVEWVRRHRPAMCPVNLERLLQDARVCRPTAPHEASASSEAPPLRPQLPLSRPTDEQQTEPLAKPAATAGKKDTKLCRLKPKTVLPRPIGARQQQQEYEPLALAEKASEGDAEEAIAPPRKTARTKAPRACLQRLLPMAAPLLPPPPAPSSAPPTASASSAGAGHIPARLLRTPPKRTAAPPVEWELSDAAKQVLEEALGPGS